VKVETTVMMKYLTVVCVSFTRIPGEYRPVTSAATVNTPVGPSADEYVQVSDASTQRSAAAPEPTDPVSPFNVND
jgi:hypothetical protein